MNTKHYTNVQYPLGRRLIRITACAALAFTAAAGAQSLDQLKGMMGGGDSKSSSSSGSGGGMSLPSLSSLSAGSSGNAAGVLQFCVKNNYLGGDASSVKDGLMSKLSGGGKPAAQSPDYLSGAKGMLKGSDGKSFDLNGGGLKEQLTKQVCDKVLAQGKSML